MLPRTPVSSPCRPADGGTSCNQAGRGDLAGHTGRPTETSGVGRDSAEFLLGRRWPGGQFELAAGRLPTEIPIPTFDDRLQGPFRSWCPPALGRWIACLHAKQSPVECRHVGDQVPGGTSECILHASLSARKGWRPVMWPPCAQPGAVHSGRFLLQVYLRCGSASVLLYVSMFWTFLRFVVRCGF